MNNTTLIHSSEHYILAEQVRLLFVNAKVSNLSLIIVASIMAIALWDLIPHWVFFSWLRLLSRLQRLGSSWPDDTNRIVIRIRIFSLGTGWAIGAAIGIGLVWLLVPCCFYHSFQATTAPLLSSSLSAERRLRPDILNDFPSNLARGYSYTHCPLYSCLLWQSGTTSAGLAFLNGLFVLLTLADGKNFQSGDHLLLAVTFFFT